jgi:hypothetical protein
MNRHSFTARALTSCGALLALAMAGCSPPAMPSQDAAVPESGADAAVEARVACPPPSSRMSFVFARISFVREVPGRLDVADGFNLDNRVSAIGDPLTCRQADMTSPDGRIEGIDNQLARLIPTVDQMTGGALDGAIQAAINNGQMLVAATVTGVDDLCDDPEVEVTLQRVAGMPFVGSDMAVDPGQTFDLMRMATMSRVRGRISGRTLETEPADVPLPVAILDAQFTVNFYGARMRMTMTQDGADAAGIIGGGISLREFMTILEPLNIPNSLRMSVNGGLSIFADLDRDAMGKCQKISGALQLMLRPAFVLE